MGWVYHGYHGFGVGIWVYKGIGFKITMADYVEMNVMQHYACTMFHLCSIGFLAISRPYTEAYHIS